MSNNRPPMRLAAHDYLCFSSRMGPIDLHVLRAALFDARRLLQTGCSPEDAVAKVCCGAWVEYERPVYVALTTCIALPAPEVPFAFLAHQNDSRAVMQALLG